MTPGYPRPALNRWIFGLVALAAFGGSAVLFGQVYRAFLPIWVCVWLAIPAAALFAAKGWLNPHLTERGLRTLQWATLLLFIGLSVVISHEGSAKEWFGHLAFKGVNFYDVQDSDGGMYREFAGITAWEGFVLKSFFAVTCIISICSGIAINAAFGKAIGAKTQERQTTESCRPHVNPDTSVFTDEACVAIVTGANTATVHGEAFRILGANLVKPQSHFCPEYSIPIPEELLAKRAKRAADQKKRVTRVATAGAPAKRSIFTFGAQPAVFAGEIHLNIKPTAPRKP